MDWAALGFSDDPLSTDPIKQSTLPLYVGHSEKVRVCRNVLSGKNVNIVIEGARGVGTTSFANYLRFVSQANKQYFTPQKEVRVEAGWTLETLLAAIIANVVRNIEISFGDQSSKDKHFQEAKAISNRIAETYRSLGLSVFGFGLNYAKEAGVVTQPNIVPSTVLGDHLEELARFAKKLGFKNGILIQLNNLDVGAIHHEKHLKYLFNSLRDYMQTDDISWILVGDDGLRGFIAQEVDRLDDIISHEVEVSPLNEEELAQLIEKRVEKYQENDHVQLPIDWDVIVYLFRLTKGRLRYVFGLLARMLSVLHVGDLTDKISLEIARPLIENLMKERLKKKNVTSTQESVLQYIVQNEGCSSKSISEMLRKSASQTSHILRSLSDMRLIKRVKKGKEVKIFPVLEVIIAYKKLS